MEIGEIVVIIVCWVVGAILLYQLRKKYQRWW